jgi:hypothetical protein
MKPEFSKKTIVFILSAGHSGSTILNLAMGAAENGLSIGEVVILNRAWKNNGICGCSKRIHDCDFWKKVVEKLPDNSFDHEFFLYQDQSQKTPYRQLSLLKNYILEADKKSWIKNNLILFETLFEVSERDFIIDSAKNLHRALILKRNLKQKFDFKFVHLIRDARAVALSHQKTEIKFLNPVTQKEEFKGRKTISFKVALNKWYHENRKIENWLAFSGNLGSSMKVRYEDFSNNPGQIAFEMEKFLGLSFKSEGDFENFGLFEHHVLGGNSSRFNSQKILPSRSWNGKISSEQRITYLSSKARSLNIKYNFE